MSTTLGDLLRTRRLALGYTIEDVAERAGISRSWLNAVELGVGKMPKTADQRRRLAFTLGLRHVDILVAAGVLDETECAVPAAPASEIETLLARVSPEVRANLIATVRDAVRQAERIEELRAALQRRQAGEGPGGAGAGAVGA